LPRQLKRDLKQALYVESCGNEGGCKRYLLLWEAHAQFEHPMLGVLPLHLSMRRPKTWKGIPDRVIVDMVSSGILGRMALR